MPVPSEFSELHKAAVAARDKSYCPYSQAKVGAAIRTKDGRTFTGCNIENSSYGATVCAERVAIQKAVSELGTLEISDVMVVTAADPPWPPCGLCRQVIAEFGKNPLVHIASPKGDYRSLKFQELYPQGFTPAEYAAFAKAEHSAGPAAENSASKKKSD